VYFSTGMFSFYAQQNSHEAATIVEFIETAMRQSQGGQCLYYLRPRSVGLAPTPVLLLHALARPDCNFDNETVDICPTTGVDRTTVMWTR